MKHLLNREALIGVSVSITLVVILFWYSSINNQPHKVDSPNLQEQTPTFEINAPEGWKIYKDTKANWNRGDLRVAFAYPSTWILREEKRENQSLNALMIEGEGYSIRIDQAGRGMSRPYDYIRSIGGFDARTWEDQLNSGKKFTFGTGENFIIYVITPGMDKEILDDILSSVVFYK